MIEGASVSPELVAPPSSRDETAETFDERAARARLSIESASSWVLRVGVISSLTVMFAGLGRALADGGVTVHTMEHQTFSADFGAITKGAAHFQPFALMELGIVLLVLTPIMRVVTSFVLFVVEEKDALYATVTFLVFVMTVSSLLFIR